MKRALAAVLSLTLLAFAGGCSSSTDTEENETGYTVDTLTMTYVESPLNVPSVIEKNKGSFEAAYKEKGLDVAYANLDSGADQTAALASGDVQILNAVGGSSVILSAANGADIKIIGMYSTSPKAFRLFSADESINSPEDLRGKTVAGPKGTNLHELIVAYLATANMTVDDVNFVDMAIPDALAALEGGSIDAALLAGPVAHNAEKAGKHMVADGEGLISGSILTATTQKFYDDNKDLVETFLAVQNETLDFIENNHDEAISIYAEATGLEAEDVEKMFTLYDFRSELTDDDLAALQKTADFMKNNGLIETEVDVTTLPLEMK
ncbi:MAG: NrtA/SsuA/CpmA family ABC transporter substrate-binding protein [Actinomycetaceae bacterium]|nr:NrtA/SsuA/CpmA family ABC transporter substrate-binding protein [Actinomycetaceae bacterium]